MFGNCSVAGRNRQASSPRRADRFAICGIARRGARKRRRLKQDIRRQADKRNVVFFD